MARDLDFSADLDSTEAHPDRTPDPHPSAPSDAPNRTYTAKEVADHWGTSDSNIRNKWINKLLDAYWWLSENDFKTGDRPDAQSRGSPWSLQSSSSPSHSASSSSRVIPRDCATTSSWLRMSL